MSKKSYGIVCSSTSRSSSSSGSEEERPMAENEKINIQVPKLDGNTRRAARKAVETVLHVDRARLLDVDSISRKYARLLPRAIWEALTDRIESSGNLLSRSCVSSGL
ncbi:unnamed protein product [Calypogeia fissa]